MAEIYKRRVNTAWWRAHIDQLTDAGRDLARRPQLDIKTYDELVSYKCEVDRWWKGVESEIRSIYSEPATLIGDHQQSPDNADLLVESRAKMTQSLNRCVLEKVQWLQKLIQETPAEDAGNSGISA